METTDKIIVAPNEQIDSIKLMVLSLEKKENRTEYDEKMLETAKFKLSALEENKIILK
jgi:hypothetical protein